MMITMLAIIKIMRFTGDDNKHDSIDDYNSWNDDEKSGDENNDDDVDDYDNDDEVFLR